MDIRFWGVRGSIATPGADTAYYGGNTSCVEIKSGRHRLICDAGTGLRALGHSLVQRRQGRSHYHIFLSHFHLDHLAGLPFFDPLYQKNVTVHLYGPRGTGRSVRQRIGTLFNTDFFPVPLAKLPAKLQLHALGAQRIQLKPFRVQSFYLNHPGQTLGYLVTLHDRRVAYVTDHEPIRKCNHLGIKKVEHYEAALLKILKDVDLMIHDAQYTDRRYPRYLGWGHSPWSYAIRLAQQAGIRQLVLFHHDPDLGDEQLKRAFQSLKHKRRSHAPRLHLAREREVIKL